MREGTSGFWYTERDGAIEIGYADFGASGVHPTALVHEMIKNEWMKAFRAMTI